MSDIAGSAFVAQPKMGREIVAAECVHRIRRFTPVCTAYCAWPIVVVDRDIGEIAFRYLQKIRFVPTHHPRFDMHCK